jgi:hypothetical protein
VGGPSRSRQDLWDERIFGKTSGAWDGSHRDPPGAGVRLQLAARRSGREAWHAPPEPFGRGRAASRPRAWHAPAPAGRAGRRGVPAAGVARFASAGPPSAPRSPALPRACSHHPRSPQLRLTGPSSAALFGRTPAAGTPRRLELCGDGASPCPPHPRLPAPPTVTMRERRPGAATGPAPHPINATRDTARRGSPPRRRRQAGERARRRPK